MFKSKLPSWSRKVLFLLVITPGHMYFVKNCVTLQKKKASGETGQTYTFSNQSTWVCVFMIIFIVFVWKGGKHITMLCYVFKLTLRIQRELSFFYCRGGGGGGKRWWWKVGGSDRNKSINPIHAGEAESPKVFLHNSKTPGDIKKKLSYINFTPLTVILRILSITIVVRCCHRNLLFPVCHIIFWVEKQRNLNHFQDNYMVKLKLGIGGYF